MSTPSIASAWQTADVAQRYKAAENATRPFAKTMLAVSARLAPAPSAPADIFDLACGTGALEAELYAALPREQWGRARVLAGDISPGMVAYLGARGEREGWTGLEVKVVDAAALDGRDGDSDGGVGAGFARVFVGFAIFGLPPDTLRTLVGKLRTGGSLAVSTWAALPWFELLARTYAAMRDAPELPSRAQLWGAMTDGRAWDDARFVEAQLREAGLEGVEVVQERVRVDCGTPEVFMSTMGFVLGVLSKQWPEERREGWTKEVGETMKGILVEEVGGVGESVWMDFEGIVGVGVKPE